MYKTSYNRKHYQTNSANIINLNSKYETINTNHHTMNRGKSNHNLKIETNDINALSRFNQRHKSRIIEKSFNKAISCDKIINSNN